MGDPTPHGVVLSFRRLAGAAAVCLFALIPQPCRAQFTQRDGQIIARTLSFIEAGTGGTLEIGIAYAPDSPDLYARPKVSRPSLVTHLPPAR